MTRHPLTIHYTEGCARELIASRAGFRSAPPARFGTASGVPDVDRQVGHTPLSVGGALMTGTRSRGQRTLTSPERRSYLCLPACCSTEQATSQKLRF